MDHIHKVLYFWFGLDRGMSLPTNALTKLWFLATEDTNYVIRKEFKQDWRAAVLGKCNHWAESAEGRLALIVLFDQFSRRIFHNHVQAYTQDFWALDLCLKGIEQGHDKKLSLLERIFFYYPLLHSENYRLQQYAILLFESLNNLSLPEAKKVFQLFTQYAYQHYEIIKNFGRFPDRNGILGRLSTDAEVRFLELSDFCS